MNLICQTLRPGVPLTLVFISLSLFAQSTFAYSITLKYLPQDSSTIALTNNYILKTKPTRKQILAMKFEELSIFSLEELTELASIVGVQSVDELLKLLVNTASKTNERINDAPGVVSVITAREIELFGAQTLQEVLQYVVSVNIATNFLYPDKISLRGESALGLTNTHILFLLNGRPMRETLIGGIHTELLVGFPLYAIERIEVLRGPGSVLYGTGAFTGTINIITKPTFNTILSARIGTFGIQTASAQTGISLPTELGNLKLSAAAFYRNRSDWNLTYRTRNAPNQPVRTDTFTPSHKTISGIFTAELGGFHAQTLVTSYSANVLGITPVFPTIDHNIFSIGSDIGYKHTFSDVFSSSLNLTHKLYQSTYESRTDAQDWIIELTNYYTPNPSFSFLLGGFANLRTGTIVSAANSNVVLIKPYSELWFTGYGEMQWQPLEAFRISAGLQANKPANTALDLVPRFNIIWNITSELGIKALYGQAYRAPSAFELFLDGPAARGNPDLRPEKVSNIDVELFWESPQARLSLTYFNGLQTDVIVAGVNRVMNRTSYANLGSYQMQGLEFEGKYAPSDDLYFLASTLFQTNLQNSTQANVAPLPDWTLKFGAGYDNHNGLSASLFYIFTGQYGGMNTNPSAILNPVPRAYHCISANLNADITEFLNIPNFPRIILNFRAENVLNEEKWEPIISSSTNALPLAPGRGFYGGIIIKF